MITALLFTTLVAVGIAIYKGYSLAQIEAEVQKLEAAAVTDGKAVIAAIKAKLGI